MEAALHELQKSAAHGTGGYHPFGHSNRQVAGLAGGEDVGADAGTDPTCAGLAAPSGVVIPQLDEHAARLELEGEEGEEDDDQGYDAAGVGVEPPEPQVGEAGSVTVPSSGVAHVSLELRYRQPVVIASVAPSEHGAGVQEAVTARVIRRMGGYNAEDDAEREQLSAQGR